MTLEYRKPRADSGFDICRPMPVKVPGVIDGRTYGLMTGWKSVVVVSSVEDHGKDGMFHHVSVSKALLGERQKAGTFDADLKHALEAFNMQEAEEDNRASDGRAHHFWLRCNQ